PSERRRARPPVTGEQSGLKRLSKAANFRRIGMLASVRYPPARDATIPAPVTRDFTHTRHNLGAGVFAGLITHPSSLNVSGERRHRLYKEGQTTCCRCSNAQNRPTATSHSPKLFYQCNFTDRGAKLPTSNPCSAS